MEVNNKRGNSEFLEKLGEKALNCEKNYHEAIRLLSDAADGFINMEDFRRAGTCYKLLGDAYLKLYDVIYSGETEIQDIADVLNIKDEEKGTFIGVSAMQAAQDSYYKSRRAFEEGGDYANASTVYVFENDVLRKIAYKEGSIFYRKVWDNKQKTSSWFWLSFLRIACDYGVSPLKFLRWVFILIGVFAILYCPNPWGNGWIELDTGNIEWHSGWVGLPYNFVNSFYFSVVTFATLGYGDILPVNLIARIAVTLEVIAGYLSFGFFLALASKKLTRV